MSPSPKKNRTKKASEKKQKKSPPAKSAAKATEYTVVGQSDLYEIRHSDDDGDFYRNHVFEVIHRPTGRTLKRYLGTTYHGFFEHDDDSSGVRRVQLSKDGLFVVLTHSDGTESQEALDSLSGSRSPSSSTGQ